MPAITPESGKPADREAGRGSAVTSTESGDDMIAAERAIREALMHLRFGSVAVGSDGEWVSIRRECREGLFAQVPALLASLDALRAENAKLREALETIDHALRTGFPAAEILDENSPIRDAIRGVAVTQPAEAVRRISELLASRAKRVYIAGPMTGIPEFNFPLFSATAADLRAQGWHVENPAEHGHVEGAEWADYLRYDIGRLATCSAIYLLPDWWRSKGAGLEVEIARALGMQFLCTDGAEITASQKAQG